MNDAAREPVSDLTVIVPTRDRPRLLAAALRSLHRQTRPPDQVIVVDDGSQPPLSASAVDALARGVLLLRHERPRGVSAARNSGLDHARCAAVLFLDDDDLIHPRMLEEALARLAIERAADAVVFGYRCFGKQGEAAVEGAEPDSPETLAGAPAIDRGLDPTNPVPQSVLESRPASAFVRYLIPIHSCVVRRQAIGPLRFPEDLVQGEDTWFWMALCRAGGRFAFDARPYAWVRRHSGNTSRSRARYEREIQACYQRLLADGLLAAPGDVYLAQLKLAWFSLRQGRPSRHLVRVALAPHRFLAECAFWCLNLGRRWRTARGR